MENARPSEVEPRLPVAGLVWAATLLAVTSIAGIGAWIYRELGNEWNLEYLAAWKRPFAYMLAWPALEAAALALLLLFVVCIADPHEDRVRLPVFVVLVSGVAQVVMSIGYWIVVATSGDEVRNGLGRRGLGIADFTDNFPRFRLLSQSPPELGPFRGDVPAAVWKPLQIPEWEQRISRCPE